ncbi:Retrotransposable element Tf2 protein [Ceratobasidium sp. AG-Ba]|nr:Retrotransposable element Tf2 protein [Ceratobasidium sp. AG-Ba]
MPNRNMPESVPIALGELRRTPAPARETKGQEELRTIRNIASVHQHALSRSLEQSVREATQTAGPTNPESKNPAPERFSGKMGERYTVARARLQHLLCCQRIQLHH